MNPTHKLWKILKLTPQEYKLLGKQVLENFSEDFLKELLIPLRLEGEFFFRGVALKEVDQVYFFVGKIAHIIRQRLFNGKCYQVNQLDWSIDEKKSFKPLKPGYAFTKKNACPKHILSLVQDINPIIQKWLAKSLLEEKTLSKQTLMFFKDELE